MMYLGIDPGLDGALAWVDAEGHLWGVEDMPTVEHRQGRKKRREVAWPLFVDLVKSYDGGLRDDGVTACLEKVHSMPGEGVSSAFRFGGVFEGIRAVLATLEIPLTLVTPQRWKKAMLAGRSKEAARLVVIERWPARADWFRRKKDHNRAEAVLIADWHRKQLVNEPTPAKPKRKRTRIKR